MYIWCCVHDCISGVVYMSCIWCYVHVASCTCGVVYTLCRYFHVHVTLCRRCCVQVVLCTWCTYGIGIHVVLCTCHTCCVADMQYYVGASCSHGIVTYVFIVLYSMYVFVLCCTLGVSVCIFCGVLDVGVCIVLCCTLGVGLCVACQV